MTLLGQDNGDDVWKFKLTTDETTLKDFLSEEDAEGVDFTSSSPVVEDWDSIIQLLDRKYPYWTDLYPLECHPLFRNKVWELLSDSNRTSKTRNTKKWMDVLNIEAVMNVDKKLEKARQLFQEAGFDLPEIPEKLAERLKKRTDLDFSTRELPESVNYIDFYVNEANERQVDDYVILSRAIWSPSVSTIHYFLVLGPLRMFLQLCWGGFRIEADVLAEQIQEIRHCFLLADQIVPLALEVFKTGERMTIVTQSLGTKNYWVAPDQDAKEIEKSCHCPKDVLGEALQWLRNNVEK